MKKVSLSKTLLLAGSVLTLAFSCTCQKKEETPPPKGPQKQPMENCECTDCECEEGASNEVLSAPQEPVTVVEETPAPALVPEVEQTLTVTPVVVEAVKSEAAAPEAVAVVKEEAPAVEAPVAQKVESTVTETVSAQKLEVSEAQN